MKFFNHPRVTLVLLGVLLLLPFIQRPLFVDDHAHFAEAIALSQGANFYKSGAHTLGWIEGTAPGEANPPVYFLVMSQVIRHFGAQLWKAHVVTMLFTLFGALSFYAIARRYVAYPGWAAVLWLVTPHVWLTANSLLLDALLAPLLLGGLALWIEGWDRENTFYAVAGAILLGAAALVKYTGLIGCVLAVLWPLLESRRKVSARWLCLALPLILFSGWMVYSRSVFGHSHFLSVAFDRMTAPSAAHAVTLLIFILGTTPALLLAIPALIARRSLPKNVALLVFVLGFAIGLLVTARSFIGIQAGLWLGGAFVWLLFAAVTCRSAWRETRFLAAWAILSVLVLEVAIPWVCARYLVILTAPFLLLTIKGLEQAFPRAIHHSRVRLAIAGGLTAFGLLLACADYEQASADHNAALFFETWRNQSAPGQAGCYPGALLGGFGYYLSEHGWTAVAPGATPPSGALVALVRRTLPPAFWPALSRGQIVAGFDATSLNPLRTLDSVSGAGFYGSIWGPLPFSFSRAPLETYRLLRTA